jgi:uncharacterized Zn finger protein
VPLDDVLDLQTVARLAGPRSLARGQAYAEEGAVRRLEVAHEQVVATVDGTRPYRVHLGVREGRITFACTCPMGEEGAFCKHCVAVALRWFEGGGSPGLRSAAVRGHLHSLGVERLTELLLEHARDDERLARRLETMAMRASGDALDVGAHRSLIDRATAVRDYVDYREAWAFFAGVDEALDVLDGLLDDGHAQEVAELAEHALLALDATCGYVDDSDGGLVQAIERVEALHLTACRQARPDPSTLAERLCAIALGSENELLSDAIERCADVLGDAGTTHFRALVEEEWAKLPVLGRDERSDRYDGRRWLVSSMMEQLARLDGDVDRLVEIKARDLSDDWAYVQIAELLGEAGRAEEALAWAERGLASAGEHRDRRLREFVADAYRRGGRAAEAVELRAEQFRDTPALDTYRALREEAEPLGEWPPRREQALAVLLAGDDASKPARRASRAQPAPAWARRDRSTLVEIFLWEGDTAAAWEHAQAGGCAPALWRRLASARATDRPEDALAVYRMLVGRVLGTASTAAYEEAVELLGELERLLAPHGRRDDHARLVAEVRHVNRRRRNLLKLLDARWPGGSRAGAGATPERAS